MAKELEVSPGFAKVADKVLPFAPGNQHIFYLEPNFIVIGNFTTKQDIRSNHISNQRTGLNAASFLAVVQDFCVRHNLIVEHFFEDSAVINGSENDLLHAQSYLGDRFSYAFTDSSQLVYMIEAEQKWALDHGQQLPRPIVRRIQTLDA